ncbi:MAG TPA: thermonuclease family protein, partial [Pirellulaceae bacterium]
GVAAPECFASKPGNELSWLACQRLRSLVRDRSLTVRLDRRQVHESGDLLGYVYADNVCLNELVLREGWAVLDPEPSDCESMVRKLQAAQQVAQRAGHGIWGR